MIFPDRWETLFQFIQRILNKQDLVSLIFFLLLITKKSLMEKLFKKIELKKFLHTIFVCLPPNIEIPNQISLEQKCSQSDLVAQVIAELIKRNKTKHILTRGYGTPRPGSDGISSMYGLQCYFTNTIVNIVKSEKWCELHSKIGDQLMFFILSETIIVMKLPNNCFLQITGYPLATYVKKQQDSREAKLFSRKSFYYMSCKPNKKNKKICDKESIDFGKDNDSSDSSLKEFENHPFFSELYLQDIKTEDIKMESSLSTPPQNDQFIHHIDSKPSIFVFDTPPSKLKMKSFERIAESPIIPSTDDESDKSDSLSVDGSSLPVDEFYILVSNDKSFKKPRLSHWRRKKLLKSSKIKIHNQPISQEKTPQKSNHNNSMKILSRSRIFYGPTINLINGFPKDSK